jgi:hypothetical protein
MISVADYDTHTAPAEKAHLRQLSQDLGIKDPDFESMLDDYEHEKFIRAGLRKPDHS